MSEPVPVVVFAYRRPDVLTRTLQALAADGVPLLHVFCDGPKGKEDRAEVDETRALVELIDWCETRVVMRKENNGLGRSVLRGMSEVFVNHDEAIVFEDDLVCVPGTYAYLVAALQAYRDKPQVLSLTAWTHPSITPQGLSGMPYFDGKAECWAWAAWRRSWIGMGRPPMDMLREAVVRGLDVVRYGPDMPVMAAEAEQRNLWAIGWWYHHILKGGLCLRPPHSMVEHIGWDERATTTLPEMAFWRDPPPEPAPCVPVTWPAPVEHEDVPCLWRSAILASASQPFPTLAEILA
jgi:hypothetical protein